MKRILITGACGFVMSHSVEHILKNTDWEIVIVDRLDYASAGFDRLRDIECFDEKRVKVFTHDLNNPIEEGLAQEIGHLDYIVHAAAGSHVDRSIDSPVEFVQNNINNTLYMLEFIRKYFPNIEKFVYFSTDEVYGTAPQGTDYSEGDRFNPGNPYSASKASAECICQAYANTYKIPTVITNTMNVIGERQHPEKYVPLVIAKVLNGEQLEIHADATKTQAGQRHYIHARNVADGLLFVLTKTDEVLDNIDSSKGRFNIVGEIELDNLELAKMIKDSVNVHKGGNLGLKYEMVDFHSQRPGHDLRYALNGDKMMVLGWEPPVAFKESLEKAVSWYLKEENAKWLNK